MGSLEEYLTSYESAILLSLRTLKEAVDEPISPGTSYELGRLDGQLELIGIIKRERPNA